MHNTVYYIVQFHSFACSCSVSQIQFVEDAIFSPLYIISFLLQIIGPVSMGLFLGYLFCSIDLCLVCLVLLSYYWITIALWYSLKLESLIHPALFFFLKITLATCGVLCFHTNFRIILVL